MQHIRFLVGLLGFVVIAALCIGNSESTPLDDYVHANDSYFAWTVIKTYQQPDYDLYILNFTSQKWLDGKVFFSFFFSPVNILFRQRPSLIMLFGGIIYLFLFRMYSNDPTLLFCLSMVVVMAISKYSELD
jgi:hypothetical protein